MNKDIVSQTTTSRSEGTIHLLDILKYLLFHWKWFLCAILLSVGYYLYQYNTTAFMYRRAETVMIKTPMNTPATARLTSTNFYTSVSVAGEIIQLQSKELIRQTIDRIQGDMSYTVRRGLRAQELYKDAPIHASVAGRNPNDQYAFTVHLIDSSRVRISDWYAKSEETIEVPLGEETNTPFGRLVIQPTEHYLTYLSNREDIRVKKYARDAMVGYFLGNMSIVQMEEDAAILSIALNDLNPERAADFITSLIKVYNETSLEDKNQIAVYTANFINERLAIIENELGSVESQIENLRTSNQGVDVGVAGEMYLSDTRQFQSERAEIETDKELVEMMSEYLNNKSKQHELIPNNTGLVDESVENQILEYNTLLLRRNRLVEGSSTANPVVQDIDKTLSSMRLNIDRAVQNTLAGLDVKLQNVAHKEQQARGKAMQVPKKQRVMLSVERQQKVKEELYLYLLNKREENAINQAMTDDNIRIIDPAYGSESPLYPSLFRKLLLGFAIGLLIPTIVLLARLMLNTSVRGRKEIQEALSVPFLGEIPFVQKAAGEQMVIDTKKRDAVSEAFLMLRTNIGFMRAGREQKVITFTSFNAGVGKTFTALNLAYSFSALKKKVILLDLDLRKGSLSERLDAPKGLGVTNFLANPDLSVDKVTLHKFIAESVDLIPIGVIAPNPVELLLGSRLDTLIATLKESYDYIIVDNVPVNLIADASIVDRISELTIFVVRAGKLDRRQLPEIQQLSDQKKLSHLSVLLNGVRLEERGYGYGYGYGYGQGYGYEPKEKKSLLDRLLRR